MLQRIQTLYLSVTFVLTVLLFFLPMANFQVNGDLYSFTAVGLEKELADGSSSSYVAYSFTMMILFALILLVNVIGIFLYKNRVFQMRFNVLNILLNLGIYPLFFLFSWTAFSSIEISRDDVLLSYSVPLIFPLFNMILTYLAVRAIGSDEALVRSLDRIR